MTARPNVALLADEHAAAIVTREAMGARCGYGSPEWYEAQAEVVRAHNRLAAAHGVPPLPITGSAEPTDYAADVERLCEHAVRAAQAHAVYLRTIGMVGDGRAMDNLRAAEKALIHAKCEMRTTLEQLREMAVRS